MPNTKDIRVKISATQKTQQTTKAMKMVSAAKLRRAQTAIVNARPYARSIESVIKKIAASEQVQHPLLEKKSNPGKVLLMVITSDRGLCGGFNNNILKYSNNWINANKGKIEKLDVICIGKKAMEFFKRRNVNTVKTIVNLASDAKYELAAEVSQDLMNFFLEGQYDEIRVIYNEFKSAISQTVVDETLLPISGPMTKADASAELPDVSTTAKIIFEPAPEVIIDQLLKKHFAVQVYRCMLESLASEHGARMAAMENATRNSGEVIRNLTLVYNKIRQAAITTELIEITSGAEALNG
ncbi:MAG: ATP synthase F1 subunit gamma [Bdellovibrionales bacterium]|nr:ATP synthase F1 subunit gamma [Bdellovibrionales bacterium]